jgi:hypothetical protein
VSRAAALRPAGAPHLRPARVVLRLPGGVVLNTLAGVCEVLLPVLERPGDEEDARGASLPQKRGDYLAAVAQVGAAEHGAVGAEQHPTGWRVPGSEQRGVGGGGRTEAAHDGGGTARYAAHTHLEGCAVRASAALRPFRAKTCARESCESNTLRHRPLDLSFLSSWLLAPRGPSPLQKPPLPSQRP